LKFFGDTYSYSAFCSKPVTPPYTKTARRPCLFFPPTNRPILPLCPVTLFLRSFPRLFSSSPPVFYDAQGRHIFFSFVNPFQRFLVSLSPIPTGLAHCGPCLNLPFFFPYFGPRRLSLPSGHILPPRRFPVFFPFAKLVPRATFFPGLWRRPGFSFTP